MNEIISGLNKRLTKLVKFEQLGFNLYSFHENNDYCEYQYHRSFKDKLDVLKYGVYLDDNKIFLTIGAIKSSITFPVVNNILSKVSTVNDETLQAVPEIGINEYTEYFYKLKNIYISCKTLDDLSFRLSYTLFQEQLETTVLPFFDKIQTLQQVNDEILEKVDWLEWSNYISGQATFKALIIMKLCNNEKKYQEFSQFYKERISNAIQEGKTEYQDLYNTLVELLNYLDSGKYLEVI